MSRWFRHYAGMMRDPKFVSVAVRCKQPLERVLFTWGCVLEAAAEANDGGRFELDPAEVAYLLRCDEADIAGILSAFDAADLTSEFAIPSWKARQFESDTSTERSRKHRQRKCNGDATLQGRDATPPETETETETETENKQEPSPDGDGPEVVAENPSQKLWSEAVPALIALGVGEKQARSVIGRWLRDADNDAERVLGAIIRARNEGVLEPVAWITAGFNRIKAKRGRTREPDRIEAAMDKLGDHIAQTRERDAGGFGQSGPGEPVLRLVAD